MADYVPISINLHPADAQFRQCEMRLPQEWMCRIMKGCLLGLEELGDLSKFLKAMKVQPRATYMTSMIEELCWYDIRLVFSIPKSKGQDGDEFVVTTSLHPPYSQSSTSLEEWLRDGIKKEVPKQIRARQQSLQETAKSWSALIEQ